MDGDGRPLAANLRRLRTRADLSAVELARRAGIGRATLTQLESGAGNPTLETLYALADELGVALADLIADRAPDAGSRVVRRGEGEHARGDVVEAWLLARHRTSELTVELYAITLHGDAPQTSAAHPAGTREHLHLHTGRALVGPHDAPVELGPGDFADTPADRPHVYRRLAGAPATGTLTILTPVRT